MPLIEHHIDVLEVTSVGDRPDVESLVAHLNTLGREGWELVSATFDIRLARFGRSHLLIFTRRSDRADGFEIG